ncbi:MAG: TRAP transporter large permease [Lautropia sp.]
MASLWMITIFLGLAAIGVPMCAAMGIGAFIGLTLLDLPLETFARYMLHDVRSVPLLAIPFFILGGNLMNAFGLTRRIFEFLQALIGFVRAGLAQAAVLSSVVFAGISGSALADIAGLGAMQISAMHKAGYRAEFASALVIAASLLTPILPPSIMFIIYAVLMNVSVGHLFVAGVLPGLLIAAVLLINNWIIAVRGIEPMPAARRSSWREIGGAFLRSFPALLAPLVILRSMVTGLVTPTEASVLAVLYALLLGLLYREITWHKLYEALVSSARTTSMIMFLTGVGSVIAFVITSERAAELLSAGLVGWSDDKWVVLSLVVFALIVMGAFIETVPAMLIAIPMFGPLVVKFGIDPVHFGVVLTYALLLGIVHPPVGLGLFAVCALTRLPIAAVTVATFRFYPAFIITLLILTFVPALSTWLPSVVFSKPAG